MKKFSINDEVYEAGRFGLRIMLYVWKINNNTDGSATYTCSSVKGRDEKMYKDNEISLLADLY